MFFCASVISALLESTVYTACCQDVDGDTPLIVACNMSDEYLAARLLSAGCRVDAAGYEDNTALHRASERGSVDLVTLLIDVADADPALTNAVGNTPLMIACENGHVDVVQVSVCLCV